MDDNTDDEPQNRPSAPTARTFTPGGSATVPTYLWNPTVKNETRPPTPPKPKLKIITIDSSPEESNMMRKALRKFRIKPDASVGDDVRSTVRKTTVEKATSHVCKIRPWKDADGSKLRKKERRRVMLALKRKKKNDAIKSSRSRKMAAAAKTLCTDSVACDDTLLNSLIDHVIHCLRGKRVYTRSFVDYVARVGTTPSAGGARGPIALILSQVGDF